MVFRGFGVFRMSDERFTLEWESDEICQVYDNGDCMGTEEVVDLMNELVTKCNSLEDDLNYYKNKCASLETGYLDYQRKNERLKKYIEDQEDRINFLLVEYDNLIDENADLTVTISLVKAIDKKIEEAKKLNFQYTALKLEELKGEFMLNEGI